MFGKMMNNYYYGKSGKGDYKRDDLPKNRWQLFFEMLRVRFSGLFRLNLLTALAFVPLMIVLVLTFNAILLNSTKEAGEMLDPLVILTSGLLFAIPAIFITGPVQAGMAYVTRNWARDEHAFLWSDFKDAVKENWKQALGVSAITSVLPFLVMVGWQFYGKMAQANGFVYLLPQMLMLLLGIVWALALTYLYPMMVTYRMSFGTLLRNSFLLAVGRLPFVTGVRLLMLLPTVLAFVVGMSTPYLLYAMMALAGYYLLLGNALARFVYASFTNAVFDRFINPRIEGAQVNRGLSPEEEEEDEAPDEEQGL